MKIGGYEPQIPFVTTSYDSIKAAINMASPVQEKMMADLGSGDGRVVIEFAKAGAIAHGYETKQDLNNKAREKIRQLNLLENAFIHEISYWDEDMSRFDIVFLYGMTSFMPRFKEKLQRELKPGSIVLSHVFRFPGWKPKMIKDHVYLYIVR